MTYGYQELPKQPFVDELGIKINFEVHQIKDGEPGSIVAFVTNQKTAERVAFLLTTYGEI